MNKLIVVRGGGDIATGTIHRLWSAGFRVLVLETAAPAAIRRQVSLSEAVYDGRTTVEGLTAVSVKTIDEMNAAWDEGNVPVLVDPDGMSIKKLKPSVVVDAILAKKNLGTSRNMAPLVIGLGPGFEAGGDVDIVIETLRGHNLGRVIKSGCAAKNTATPGEIGGFSVERVVRAPANGIIHTVCSIGEIVRRGDKIAEVETEEGRIAVTASIDGILRGMIRNSYCVTLGFKIADIDPRLEEQQNCFTMSDKARAIGGSVLEQVCHFFMNQS